MSALILALCILGQDTSQLADSPAARYKAALQHFTQSSRKRGLSSDDKRKLRDTMISELRGLLEWESGFSGPLSSEDCIALSEAANRLRKPDIAVHYATQSLTGAKDIEPYVVLVRSLCNASQMDLADARASEAISLFPQSTRAYLLWNFIALRYRALNAHDRAYEYMIRTTDAVLANGDYNEFFIRHLKTCIEQARQLAERASRVHEFQNQLFTWNDQVNTELSKRIQVPETTSIEIEMSLVDLAAVSMQSQALVVINQEMVDGDVEYIYDQWISSLVSAKLTPNTKATRLGHLKIATTSMAKSLSPQIEGARLERRLQEALTLLSGNETAGQVVSEDQVTPRVHAATLNEIKDAIRLLQQHQRHRQIVGKSKVPEWRAEHNALETGEQFTLLHVFNPFAKNLPDGLKSIDQLRIDRYRHIRISFAAVQSGLAWDAGNRRLYRVPSQTVAQEASAIEELKRRLRLREDVRLISLQSDEFKLLEPAYLPLNVLMDADGKVRCILTGPEPEKVLRLAALTTPGRETED
jgi:hypothetical protein